jgi:adenosylcobinamide amidohydrolase
MVPTPQLQLRQEHGRTLAARFWPLAAPMLAISSAPLGGGMGLRQWVLNVQVPHDYDGAVPAQHLAELAAASGLTGSGIGMMTAVDVRTASVVHQEGVSVDATVGVTGPQWAAADHVAWDAGLPATTVGTINIVITLPERLSDAALVNAVSTATEAKSQALWEAGVGGTGTATDALCVLCPPEGTGHPYGGPRSLWGARLARAVHRAVLAGCQPGHPS